jgi:hypothetical protein
LNPMTTHVFWIHPRFIQTPSHPAKKNVETWADNCHQSYKKVMPTISKSWRTYQMWSIFFKGLLLLKRNNLWFDHSKFGIYDILCIPYIKWNMPWLSQPILLIRIH